MKIEVDISLNSEESKQLAGILSAKVGDLGKSLQPFAKSAIEEYVRMFLGQRVFTRGRDALEFRLFLLIRGAFGNKIPDEKQVCALFQCSPTQARSLIRAVMAKFQYDLSDAIGATLTETVRQISRDEQDKLSVIINSENVVDALNVTLASIDGSLPQVSTKKGTVSTYEVKESSYEKLCDRFNVEPKAPQH
jgi:hypothetical protein